MNGITMLKRLLAPGFVIIILIILFVLSTILYGWEVRLINCMLFISL